MQALGRQILVEFYECDCTLLEDQAFIEHHMITACKLAEATVVAHTFHKFSPHGVSGAVIIAESHVAIHTWPEYGYAAVDIFTCGESISPWVIFKYLKEQLKAGHASNMELKRGLFDVDQGKLPFKPE